MSADPLAWLDDELERLDALDLRRRLATRDTPQCGAAIKLDGRQLVNFGSNDYLGLAAERLTAAVQAALEQGGWGSGASPLVSGRATAHAHLEAELAEFEACEAALLFPSGYAANMGAICSLVGKGDVIFSDAKNHASIIDGCRLSGAAIGIYQHSDVADLQRLLEGASGYRRALIVTDGLFSMDGDLAPLGEIALLAKRFGAMLMVDEAHATGVFGSAGRGVCEALGVDAQVHVRVGTLSKALGSIGGFVVGSRRLIDCLANRARPYVFSTAPPEAMAAAALEAVRIVRQEPERRDVLLRRAATLRTWLRQAGWKIGRSCSQIVPVMLGDARTTMRYTALLRDGGFFVPGIRPPSVPEGESLLRISVTYDHTVEMLRQLIEALNAAAGRK